MQPLQQTIRVFLVDDHPTILWGLKNLIEAEQPRMEVIGMASNCEEARVGIQNLVPDVILLDIDLGGKSSLDILPDLLSNSVSRVLVLTGTRDQEILDLAVQRGAHGILKKDVPAEQIVKAIVKIFQGELWLDRETLGRIFNGFIQGKQEQKPDIELTKQASLTAKERLIISAIVTETGATNKVIADQLFISEHTLRNHLTSIYHKLQVNNRLGLYVYASKHQIGKPGVCDEDKTPKSFSR